MTRLRKLLGALLLLHAPFTLGQVHEGETIVTARLVADTVRVQPGGSFTAAVHLTIAPGWHVYWENPGDTALPIGVEWQLPDGAKASPLRWPAPERYQEGGGVTVFGYEREAALLSTVSAGRSFGDSFELRAKAEWLVCEKICIPGEATLGLTLPRGGPSPSPDAAMIRRFAAKIPTPGEREGVRIVDARAKKEGDLWRFTIEVDPAGRRVARFFPRTIEGFLIDHGGIAVKGTTIRFTALPDEPRYTPRSISGVIVTDRGTFDVARALAIGDAPPPAPLPPSEALSGPPAESPPPPAPTSTSVPADDWLRQEFKTSGASNTLSLPMLLLFSFLGGLLLNVMPCVLPVISLKVLSFVHQAGQDVKQTRVLGLLFGAGVVISFWILVATVAAVRATAAQVGWGFQFQSPLFVLAMSVVVLIFAMNLFGVFEIAGPSFSGAAADARGRRGAFLHGVLATALATPCTAPFLGTAIGFAFTQPLPILFLAFTAAAVGLALPYVLLSWHPAWLRRLPRPGAWMIRFKQAMGFVLVGTVVWLLSVLSSQLGPEGVIWSIVFLTFVAFAVWIIGQVPPTAKTSTRVACRVAAVALAAGGYYWAMEHELRWREPVEIESAVAGSSQNGIQWQPFSLADLRSRVERGETVLVDFTADWCWSCKVNERTVLSSASVEEQIRRLDVTAVKADWTRRNPEITQLLAKFGRAGVPFYVVFPAGRLTEPIALSEVITPSSVIDALQRAGPSRKAERS